MKKVEILIIFTVFYSIFCFSASVQAIDLRLIHSIKTADSVLPYEIAVRENGQVIVIDKAPAIRSYDQNGNALGVWNLQFPEGIAVNAREQMTITFDSHGDFYLTLENARTVLKYSSDLVFLQKWTNESFSWVESLLLADADQFYLADNSKLMLINAAGEIVQSFENLQLWQPMSLAASSEGNIYIADTSHTMIKVINPDGQIVNQWGQAGFGPEQFLKPRAVAFDRQERLWVLDSNIHDNITSARFQLFSKWGELLQVFELRKVLPESQVFFPIDFTLSGNRLYLLDMAEQCVKVYEIIENPGD